MVAKTIAELRNTTEEKLIEEHDHLAQNTAVGTSYYLDELRRRESARQEATMLRLTRVSTILTAVVTAATIINLFVFISSM